MKKIFFIIGFSAVLFSAYSQSINVLDYRRKVLDYSQDLKKAREGVISADEQIRAAKTGFLPKLDVSADFNYMAKKISFDLGPDASLSFQPYTYSAGATVAQNVYNGGAVKKQVDLLKTGSDIANLSELLTIDNIVYAADMSYWATSAMDSYLGAAKKYLGVINETYDIVKTRFDDGLISKTDLLMVETRQREAEYQYGEAEKQYKTSVINLNILMGQKAEAEVLASDSIFVDDAVIPLFVSLEEVCNRRQEYAIAEKQIKIGEQKMALTKSAYLPKIAVGFTGQYATKALNIDGKGMGNGIAFAQVKVPIFNWNEKKYKVAVDKSNIRSSGYELQNVSDNISKEVSSAWTNLNQSFVQLDIAQKSLDIAEESLSLNMFSYTDGLLTILDVLSAQMSWISAYNNLITTNYNYRVALSQYQKAVGDYASYYE